MALWIFGVYGFRKADKNVFGRVELTFRKFIEDERGQDLVEYTLLLAFIMLASGAIFIEVSDNTMWNSAASTLVNANAFSS